MGLKDAIRSILGTPDLPRASLEKMFAISAAGITMQSGFDMKPSPKAGICFKPVESSSYETARREIEELLSFSSHETGTAFKVVTDAYRFTWVVLEDPDFEDLLTSIHLISQTFIEKGFGAYLLCAIFRFEDEKPVYWVYNFKQARYYPFVPAGEKNRDIAMEFRMRSLLERELPLETDVRKWYPLWGIPL